MKKQFHATMNKNLMWVNYSDKKSTISLKKVKRNVSNKAKKIVIFVSLYFYKLINKCWKCLKLIYPHFLKSHYTCIFSYYNYFIIWNFSYQLKNIFSSNYGTETKWILVITEIKWFSVIIFFSFFCENSVFCINLFFLLSYNIPLSASVICQ